jgi:hypothetical protein
MKKFTLLEGVAYLALFAMSVVWTGYGWYLFLEKRFFKGYRYTTEGVYVEGLGAILMSYLFLSLAAISMAIILKRLNAPQRFSIAAAVVLLGSPLLSLLAR